MSDYLDPGRFEIREWSGARRLFPPEEGPLRPRRALLTTTLEAAYSSAEDGPGGDHSCIFRKDNDLWHSHNAPYLPLGACLSMVTILTGENSTFALTVRDRGHGLIPPKFYLLPLSLQEGYNHISWCAESGIGLYSSTAADLALFGSPDSREHFRWAFSRHFGPSIFFQHDPGEILQTYQLKDSGKYALQHPHSPVYTPRFQATPRSFPGITHIPPYLFLYATSASRIPSWASEVLDVPVSDHPRQFDHRSLANHHNIHLRYELGSRRRAIPYSYGQWDSEHHYYDYARAARDAALANNALPVWRYCPFGPVPSTEE